MPASVGIGDDSIECLSNRYWTRSSPHFPIWAVVAGMKGVAAVMADLTGLQKVDRPFALPCAEGQSLTLKEADRG
jgi:hypothetical protein